MEVLDAIRGRRTAVKFSAAPIAREEIEALIEAATWAPNHKHTEPWRFQVFSGDSRRALVERLRAADPDGKDPTVKLTRAPVCIVVAQPHAEDPVQDIEDYAAASCAVQNLMLAAHARGLATRWSTGALVESPAAKRVLGLSERDRIVAFVNLGRPSEEEPPHPVGRKPPIIEWHGPTG